MLRWRMNLDESSAGASTSAYRSLPGEPKRVSAAMRALNQLQERLQMERSELCHILVLG